MKTIYHQGQPCKDPVCLSLLSLTQPCPTCGRYMTIGAVVELEKTHRRVTLVTLVTSDDKKVIKIIKF